MLSASCNISIFHIYIYIYLFISTLCKVIFHALLYYFIYSMQPFLISWNNSLEYENTWIYVCLSIAIIPPTQNFYQK